VTDFLILDRLKITVVAKVFIFCQITGGADNMGGDARSLQLALDAMRRSAFGPSCDRAFDLLAITQAVEQRVELTSGQRVPNDPTEDLPLAIG
jgi:hypothetical protein